MRPEVGPFPRSVVQDLKADGMFKPWKAGDISMRAKERRGFSEI